jgi:hypothetical protein
MISPDQFRQGLAARDAKIAQLTQQVQDIADAVKNRPITPEDMLNTIKGRRIFYNLVGSVSFTAAADNGKRGVAISMTISQDGPFVMTHYPMAMWKPNLPSNADNYGQWMPVYTWPLPTAQTGSNTDTISISYEMVDTGSQRNFQNQAAPPVLSYPGNLHPLPTPTLLAPNTVLQFIPTYEDINMATNPSVDTTGGLLVVSCPGYRIVSL